jgi:hypothetical protein
MPEQKKVNHWKQGDYKHLTAGRWKTETDPVSETLCFLFVEIRMMDKVQKLSSNECYTPLSEPFRRNIQFGKNCRHE